MTDKQIIIDYKNLCENYSKEVGCFGTFDGSCIKEQCFTYKLLQKLKAKEQECERLKLDLIEAKAHRDYLNNLALSETLNLVSDQLDKINAELEQEKALKETYLACYHAKHEDLAKKYDQLKAENDLAKQLINWILKFFELTDYDWQDDQNEISALIEDYIDDKNSTIDFVNDINKGLFKKLTEIKEIAEEAGNTQYLTFPDFNLKQNVKMLMGQFNGYLQQILQKISEVTND